MKSAFLSCFDNIRLLVFDVPIFFFHVLQIEGFALRRLYIDIYQAGNPEAESFVFLNYDTFRTTYLVYIYLVL
jgi:hypothetical protein